jgi:hypothetical protein
VTINQSTDSGISHPDKLVAIFSTSLDKGAVFSSAIPSPSPKNVTEITTEQLDAAFGENEVKANKTYQGKWLKIKTLTVTSIKENRVYLEGSGRTIFCDFNEQESDIVAGLERGEILTVIGIFDKRFLASYFVKNCRLIRKKT